MRLVLLSDSTALTASVIRETKKILFYKENEVILIDRDLGSWSSSWERSSLKLLAQELRNWGALVLCLLLSGTP